VDWRLTLDPTDLRSHVTRAALVLDDEVYALDHNPILAAISAYSPTLAVDLVAPDHSMHRSLQFSPLTAGSGCIPTCHNFNRIASFDPFHLNLSSVCHKTSGAKDTIFMNPSSRSSRATGPKMRVPLGFFAWSRITAALSSNLM
jgi:hypothetical protein